MKISDLITNEILRMINESQDNIAEIQRNDFANEMAVYLVKLTMFCLHDLLPNTAIL